MEQSNDTNKIGSKTKLNSIKVETLQASPADIAKEAYSLYVQQGYPQGCADQHWFQAEATLHHHGADHSIHHSNHHSQHHNGHHS